MTTTPSIPDMPERVLVCVGPSPMSARLVRAARHVAVGFRAPWLAVFVETPGAQRLTDEDRQRLDQNLRLAEQLGAETVTLSGEHVAEELVAYAIRRKVTKIVIGKPARSRWKDALLGSLVDDVIRRSGEIDVYVITGTEEEPSHSPLVRINRRTDWKGYFSAVIVVLLATTVGWLLYHGLHLPNESRSPTLPDTNILMLYLLGVLWIATRHSRRAAVLASVLGVAAFDLCFVPPYLTLAVSDRQYILTFAIMLLTALVISTLTNRVRAQAEAARQRESRTATLFALTRELAGARGIDTIAEATVRHVAEVIDGRIVLLLPDAKRNLAIAADSQQDAVVSANELSIAQWAFEHQQSAGVGTDNKPTSVGTYVPLKASRGIVGVLGLLTDSAAGWEPQRRQLSEALAAQAALAVERAQLAEEAQTAWERVEEEFLRNTLLSGVSHELRTPLAAITGSVSALTDSGDGLSAQSRGQMLETIQGEAERMERLITNLLDMTRMESGGLVLKKEWLPLAEVVGQALRQMDRRLTGRKVLTDLPCDLPMVHVDSVAIEQVLANLLDNAVEYTPTESPIELVGRQDNDGVSIEVRDHGPGLPAGAETRVFDKFFRAQSSGSRRGIGLGLAICRGIVQAHGGSIAAGNRAEGGAVFRISLPNDGSPPTVDATA